MTLDFFHTFKKLSKLYSHCSLPLESMNKRNAQKCFHKLFIFYKRQENLKNYMNIVSKLKCVLKLNTIKIV
jgi:hypothetical protein